ncbi:MAG: hypothetical protein GC171_04640 [Terrimonas sp.]|nr:hypothetical protein [Terrimonas sp.]
MKKIFLLLVLYNFSFYPVWAQSQRAKPVKPDLEKMMQMTPGEIEVYKEKLLKQASSQVKDRASMAGIPIDETVLPGFEIQQPPKDLKRLAMIPPKLPSKTELMAGVQQSLQQINAVASPAVRQDVKKITTEQDPSQMERTAIALWYGDQPLASLLVSIAAVQKKPETTVLWNNLAALYNMAGLEEKAVPILLYQLQSSPASSLLLNNLGQSFLGLGDMGKAEMYLSKCLALDEGNPEANRSMGMINLFKKEYATAQKYFEKELEVSHRRSTLALMRKKGMPIDLNALRKRRTGIPHRDYFEEIGLGKFRMPDFPEKSGESDDWHQQHAGYLKSLQSEYLFWTSIPMASPEAIKAEGKRPPGLYADLEDELTRELGSTFAPLLGIMTEEDGKMIDAMIKDYYSKLAAVQCPSPPTGPNVGQDIILAYQKKCCDKKKAIADEYVARRNAYIRNRFIIVDARWKEYINGMISNIRLNPTEGNKRMVYHAVAEYFGFLISTLQTAVIFEPAPVECMSNNLTASEADDIIAASHDIDLSCPSWLNISIDLQVASLKADCGSYGIEGGKGLLAGYEKNFKTGTSTISAGVGASQHFGTVLNAGVKQMVYVSFDNNNQFSDFGLKGTAGVTADLVSEQLVTGGIGKITNMVAGVEGGYTLSLNSGFKPFVTGKGILSGTTH